MCNPVAIGIAGLAVSAGGSLMQGAMAQSAANDQAAAVKQQKAHEKALYATQEIRTRAEFDAAIAEQAAQITAAGFQADSPSAIALARAAATEKIFEAQSVRSFGQAKAAELTATERSLRAQGREAMFNGVANAAGAVINAAPTIWPGLFT